MQATVTVFDNETHFDFFEPDLKVIEQNKYADNYAANLGHATETIQSLDMIIKSRYAEINEFGQPVVCYFTESIDEITAVDNSSADQNNGSSWGENWLTVPPVDLHAGHVV